MWWDDEDPVCQDCGKHDPLVRRRLTLPRQPPLCPKCFKLREEEMKP